jgi:hypothetical protein
MNVQDADRGRSGTEQGRPRQESTACPGAVGSILSPWKSTSTRSGSDPGRRKRCSRGCEACSTRSKSCSRGSEARPCRGERRCPARGKRLPRRQEIRRQRTRRDFLRLPRASEPRGKRVRARRSRVRTAGKRLSPCRTSITACRTWITQRRNRSGAREERVALDEKGLGPIGNRSGASRVRVDAYEFRDVAGTDAVVDAMHCLGRCRIRIGRRRHRLPVSGTCFPSWWISSLGATGWCAADVGTFGISARDVHAGPSTGSRPV